MLLFREGLNHTRENEAWKAAIYYRSRTLLFRALLIKKD